MSASPFVQRRSDATIRSCTVRVAARPWYRQSPYCVQRGVNPSARNRSWMVCARFSPSASCGKKEERKIEKERRRRRRWQHEALRGQAGPQRQHEALEVKARTVSNERVDAPDRTGLRRQRSKANDAGKQKNVSAPILNARRLEAPGPARSRVAEGGSNSVSARVERALR
jgi:hypothetical protein